MTTTFPNGPDSYLTTSFHHSFGCIYIHPRRFTSFRRMIVKVCSLKGVGGGGGGLTNLVGGCAPWGAPGWSLGGPQNRKNRKNILKHTKTEKTEKTETHKTKTEKTEINRTEQKNRIPQTSQKRYIIQGND